MKISTKGEYGLMALIDLTLHQNQRPVQIFQISERQGIPKQYLDQLMLNLKRSGIVASSRGRQGGYFLARPAKEVTLLDIITALEGPVENRNFTGRSLRSNLAARQVLKTLWDEIYSNTIQILGNKSLDEICELQKKSEEHLMYHI
jgi:Rrf2 family protein